MGLWDRPAEPVRPTPPPVQTVPIGKFHEPEQVKPALSESVEQQLKTLARKIKNSRRKELQTYVEIGGDLSAAQQLLAAAGRDGEFAKWFRNLGLSKSHVYRSIDAHKHFGNCPNLERFTKGSIEILAKYPTARARALEEAEAGNQVSQARAKELVKEHEPKAEKKKDDRPEPIILQTPDGFVKITLKRSGISPATVLSQAMAQLARNAA